LTILVLVVSALLFGGAIVIGNRSGLVRMRWARAGELYSLTVPAAVLVLTVAINPSIVVVSPCSDACWASC
jgi:hypothetical protein